MTHSGLAGARKRLTIPTSGAPAMIPRDHIRARRGGLIAPRLVRFSARVQNPAVAPDNSSTHSCRRKLIIEAEANGLASPPKLASAVGIPSQQYVPV